ncbi:MAG TPA: FkbM family methyltransferase [Thermoanaerobaculia bacterium]|jgi:FkbM family methyltransferase|nr:FkbM family methyltransferase [Thermoanaerobaculia bacterium]
MRILSGPLRGQRWIRSSATNGCWAGTYERESQRVFREHVQPAGVVFDIGANVGFFTLLAAKLAKDGFVYAFEPLPGNLGYLRRHLALNQVRHAEILPIAVAASTGTARFAAAPSPSMGALAADGGLEVAIDTLDRLVSVGRIRPPNFIKIDVEGAEHDVLRGAASVLREAKPTIFLSAHGWQQHELCSALLAEAGYRLELLRDGTADGNYLVLAR